MPINDSKLPQDESFSLWDLPNKPIVDMLPSGVKESLENRAHPTLDQASTKPNIAERLANATIGKIPVVGHAISEGLPLTPAKMHGFSTGAFEAITPMWIANAAQPSGLAGKALNYAVGGLAVKDAVQGYQSGDQAKMWGGIGNAVAAAANEGHNWLSTPAKIPTSTTTYEIEPTNRSTRIPNSKVQIGDTSGLAPAPKAPATLKQAAYEQGKVPISGTPAEASTRVSKIVAKEANTKTKFEDQFSTANSKAESKFSKDTLAAKAIQDAKEGGLVKQPPTVTESASTQTPEGKASVSTKYTQPPPIEEGDGGDSGPDIHEVPKNTFDAKGRPTFVTGNKTQAIKLGQQYGASLYEKANGGYKLHYAETVVPTETPVEVTRTPKGPATPKVKPTAVQKFNQAVDANLSKAPELSGEPSIPTTTQSEVTPVQDKPVIPPPPPPEIPVTDTRMAELAQKFGGKANEAPSVAAQPLPQVPAEAPPVTPPIEAQVPPAQQGLPLEAQAPVNPLGQAKQNLKTTAEKSKQDIIDLANKLKVENATKPQDPKWTSAEESFKRNQPEVLAEGPSQPEVPPTEPQGESTLPPQLDKAIIAYKKFKGDPTANPLFRAHFGMNLSDAATNAGEQAKIPVRPGQWERYIDQKLAPEIEKQAGIQRGSVPIVDAPTKTPTEPSVGGPAPPRPNEPTTTPNTDTKAQTSRAREAALAKRKAGQVTPTQEPVTQPPVEAPNQGQTEDQATVQGLQEDLNKISQMSPEERQSFIERLKSSKGMGSTELLSRMGLGALGSWVGAEADPLHNKVLSAALIGGGAAFTPELVRALVSLSEPISNSQGKIKSTIGNLNTIHNAGLLSPLSVAKKALGDVGGMATAAIKNPGRAGDLMKALLNKEELLNDFKTGYNTDHQENLSGLENLVHDKNVKIWDKEFPNPLSMSGRTMGGLTKATKGALGRANFTPEEQAEYTFTNQPKSKIGEKVLQGIQGSPILQHFAPFARIGINRAEQGFNHSPLGLLNLLSEGTPQEKTEILRDVGIGSVFAAEAYGLTPKDFIKKHPTEAGLITALMGPMGIPVAFAMAAKGNKSQPMAAGMKEATRDLPGFRFIEDIQSPEAFGRNYLSGYTNITRPIAEGIANMRGEAKPDVKSKHLSFIQKQTNQALSNIPGIREQLPTKGSKK